MIQRLHEQDPRHNPFDFVQEPKEAPEFMHVLLENHESLPWRRRDFEREALLDKLMRVTGFPKTWGEEQDGGEERVRREDAQGSTNARHARRGGPICWYNSRPASSVMSEPQPPRQLSRKLSRRS